MNTVDLDQTSDELTTLLLHLNKKIFNMENLFKSFHLPPSHVKVIFYLAHMKSSSISKIARELCISKPNMTPIIDKLIGEGLVNRSEDPTDRRVLKIELTDKAHDMFKEHRAIMKNSLMNKLSSLEHDDLIELCNCISSLHGIIKKI